MADDNQEEIKVTADISELKAQLAEAKASLKSFTKTIAELQAQEENAGSGVKSQFTKLLAEETARADEARVKVAQLTAALESAAGGGAKAAVGAEQAESAFSKLRFGTSGVIQELVRMTRAIATGRWDILPSELATMASRMGGLGEAVSAVGGGAIAAGAGVLALVGAEIYMIYKTEEAEKKLEELTAQMQIMGNASSSSRGFIEAQSDELDQMSGVSTKARDAVLALEVGTVSLTDKQRQLITQTMPAFVKMYGDEAPNALKKTVDAAQDLSLSGLQKLDHDILKLTTSQYENIASMVASGHQGQALEAILAVIGERAGISVKTIQGQIDELTAHLGDLRTGAQLAQGDLEDQPAWLQIQAEIQETTEKIDGLRDALKNVRRADVDSAIREELAQAEILNNSLHERLGLEEALRRAEAARDASRANGASGETIALLQQDVNNRLKVLQDYDRRQTAEAAAAAQEASRLKIEASQADVSKLALIGDARLKAEIDANKKLLLDDSITGKARTELEIRIGQEESQLKERQLAEVKRLHEEKTRLDNKELSDEMKMARDEFATKQTIARSEMEQAREQATEQFQLGLITADKKYQILLAASVKERELRLDAAKEELRESNNTLVDQTHEANQEKIIWAQYYADIAKLRLQDVADNRSTAHREATDWRAALGEITSAEDTLVRDIIGGRKTLVQSLAGITEQFLEKELSADLKYLTQRLFLSQQEIAADTALGQKGLLFKLLSEDTHTAAVVTGAATRTAAEVTAANAGHAAQAAAGSLTILNDAKQAGAGAYSATVGIPYIGPIIAPIAAATAFGAVLAFDTLTSAEGGDWDVGRGGLYNLHPEESVMPASIANPMRDFFTDGGASGGGGGHATVNIYAMDGADVHRVLSSNKEAVAKFVAHVWESNPSAMPRSLR